MLHWLAATCVLSAISHAAVLTDSTGRRLEAGSPGALAVLEGEGLARRFERASAKPGPLPEALAGVRLLVSHAGAELPARLLSVAPSRIEFLFPSLPAGGGTVTLRVAGDGAPVSVSVPYAPANPAVIHSDGDPSMTDADARQIRANEPLQPGQEYVLYATGLGTARDVTLLVDGRSVPVTGIRAVSGLEGVFAIRFRQQANGRAARSRFTLLSK